MDLSFVTTKENLIEFQLYNFSINKKKTNKIKTNLYTIFFYVIFLINLIISDYYYSLIFLILALVFHFFFPIYLKKRYQKHFENHVNQYFSERFNKINHISIENDCFIINNEISESKYSIKSIVKIHENKNLFLIFIIGGNCLILPKNEINEDELKQLLKNICLNNNIVYFENLNWKW